MIDKDILKIIRTKIIKHNFYKNNAVLTGANNTHEYDFCLYINPKYADKYFVMSKENTFRGDSLNDITWKCYVFNNMGEDIDFKKEKINFNDFVKESEKICNII